MGNHWCYHATMTAEIPAKAKITPPAHPLSAAQAQEVEPQSTPHLEANPLEQPLATQKRIDLSWHWVCNQYEHEELSRYNAITAYKYSDPRHEIFDKLKWPTHSRWQGGWGPEPMYYDAAFDFNRQTRLCIVYATDRRAEEIRQWIREQMFNLAPGND